MPVRYRRAAGLALCIIGLLLLGRGLYEVVGGKIYQEWRGRQLDRALDSLPPRPAPEARRVVYTPGTAIGRLEVPRIGLSVVVLEGSDPGTLRLGAGRLSNSSIPGEVGNVVLAGHRDTFFRSLREIRQGDRVSLRTPEGKFGYTVDWTQVVNPTDTEVLQPTPSPALTLVTCYPFYYLGSAPQRFIVRARPTDTSTVDFKPTPMPPAAAKVKPKRPSRPKPQAIAALDPPPIAEGLAVEATPPDDPPPTPKRGIKRLDPRGAFHKFTGLFSGHRKDR